MLSSPGINWPLQFDDEFNGSSVDATKWTPYLPWSNSISGDNRYHATNNAYASYMEPADVVESGGSLQLSTAQGNFYSTNETWFGYSEGMLTTNSTFWYTYGYAEIRAKLPTGAGNWPAFWALSNGWPPENDIMEAGPGSGINHQGLYDMSSTWTGGYLTSFPANTWHTYGLEWGPGYEKFYEDGNVTFTMSVNVPAEGMYFLLNSGVATASDANYSNSNNNTLDVDYVHVYGYNSTNGPQLINGGMEASNSGFTSSSSYGAYSMSTTNPRTGYDDLQIAGYGAGQQTVTGLSPNTTYTYSAWGYSTVAGSYGYIGVKNFGGTETSTQFAQTTWGQDAVTFTTGSTNTSALLYLYNPSSTVTTYYDDASLELTPLVSPISSTIASPSVPVTVPITVTQEGSGSYYSITATSSNQTLIPNSNLTVGGTTGNPTLALTVAAGQVGTSTITVNLTDIYGGTASTSFVVTGVNPVTINGDSGGTVQNDVFRLVRSGTSLNLYQNNSTNTPTQSYIYSATGLVAVNGLGGSNKLLLDYSGGDPVPVNGLSFNGGSGTNTLVVENMPGAQSANLSNGSLVVESQSISFTNLSSLNVDLGSGSSTLFSATSTFTPVLSLSIDAGATLSLSAGSALPTNSIVNISATGLFKLSSQTESIDQLTGAGTLNTGTTVTTLSIGANNGSSLFTGSITGSGGLTKIGTGTLILSGSNSFTGPVNLGTGATTGGNVDGVLQITSAAALGGVSQVNVNDNNTAYATLQLNSSTGIALPSSVSFLLNANSAGVSGTAATLIESVAGANTIGGAMSLTIGGAGYGIKVDSGTLGFTGPQPATSHVLFLSGAGSGSFTFGLVGTASVVAAGPGGWTLNGPNSYSGYTNISGGTFNVSASASIASTSVTVMPGGTLNMLGTLPGTATVTANGAVNFGATTSQSLVVRNLTALTIGNTGAVVVNKATNHLYRTLLALGSLTFSANTGTLDLTNNDLDVSGGNLTTPTSLAAGGFTGGTLNGTGIISSTAANDSTHLTTLGIIVNNTAGNTLYASGTLLGPFDGTSPGANDVLVKYTYYGDANLNGKVDGSDYALIDSGSLTQVGGWFNGDFNGDLTVNGSDYTLIDNAFNSQGNSLTASAQIAPSLSKSSHRTLVPQVLQTVNNAYAAFASGGPFQQNDEDILVDMLNSLQTNAERNNVQILDRDRMGLPSVLE